MEEVGDPEARVHVYEPPPGGKAKVIAQELLAQGADELEVAMRAGIRSFRDIPDGALAKLYLAHLVSPTRNSRTALTAAKDVAALKVAAERSGGFEPDEAVTALVNAVSQARKVGRSREERGRGPEE